MKCPSCNKFAAYEEPEVEANDPEIDSGGSVTLEGRMALRSECCSEELKEWNFILEGQVEHDAEEGEHEFEVEIDGGEPTASDYYSGKPGTPARYRKHMYVVEASLKVTCSCGFETTMELKDELQASGFDELT